MKTMCRCNTIVAFSLKTISFSMKTYSCRRGLNYNLLSINKVMFLGGRPLLEPCKCGERFNRPYLFVVLEPNTVF